MQIRGEQKKRVEPELFSGSTRAKKWSPCFLQSCYDLIVFDAASQVTGFCRKYDSFAMWHAMAALFPNTASSVTGLRDFTDSKNTFKCGRISSQSCPL